MKPKPDNFEDLVALLSLKRHEQPPPDYFEELPQLVVARLQIAQSNEPAPWWQRWWNHFEGQPVLVGAYCVAVCGLLFSGLSLSRMAAEENGTPPIDDYLREMATMRLPLTIDKLAWNTPMTSAQQDSSLTPMLGLEPTLLQINVLQPKTRPAGLYFEGN